jgi:outer membrane protein
VFYALSRKFLSFDMKKAIFTTFSILAFSAMAAFAQVPNPRPTQKPADDTPPVAPKFETQTRPLPNAERIGVDSTNQLSLTLREAIELALKNNNDIDGSKINSRIAEENLKAAEGTYDPRIVSESFFESRTTPTASTIGGAGSSGGVTQQNLSGTVGVEGTAPKGGGTYSATFSSSRTTTNNQNATLNPQFPSALTLTYTQPLWRGLKIDNERRTIDIAKKNLKLTDSQFRQRVIETVSRVEQAYWDLVFALRNLQVQNDAVKQARVQLESNQRLVEKGVLAPIEIVAATSQITNFEQNVYSAQEVVTVAENNLKSLILDERTSGLWSRPLTPVSPVEIEVPRVPLEFAVAEAMKNRQELQQIETNSDINQINKSFLKDQTKPQVDLVGTYTTNGLAGGANNITRVTNAANLDLLARVDLLSTLNGLTPLNLQPTTTVTSPPGNLVGNYLNSLGNLIQQDYPTYRVGVRITLPLRNSTAEAELGRNLAEGDLIKNQRSQAEQQIEAKYGTHSKPFVPTKPVLRPRKLHELLLSNFSKVNSGSFERVPRRSISFYSVKTISSSPAAASSSPELISTRRSQPINASPEQLWRQIRSLFSKLGSESKVQSSSFSLPRAVSFRAEE